MNLKQNIISLLQRLGQASAAKNKAAPQSLSPETMGKVMEEVKFLRAEHAVDVRELAPGEIPTNPKRADE